MKTKSKNILITGVSTGIGYDLAKVFLSSGYKVYGSVRKQEDADRLASELKESFQAVIFDVTDFSEVDKAAKRLEAEIGEEGLAGLVNNAGIAVAGPFIDLSIEDFKHQFDVNVFGMIKVTQSFLPLLGARPDHSSLPGKIVQISSVSGRMGMPFVSAYVGSKYALEGISESMRKELLLYGIDVVLIEPGPIKTPIWRKSMDPLLEKFKGSDYSQIMKKSNEKFMGPAIENALSSERAVKLILKEFEKPRSRSRVVIVAQKFKNWTLPMILPTRILDRIIGKALGLSKK